MPGMKPGRWTEIREREVGTSELREQYERTKHAVVSIRQTLMDIDSERERIGMSKAELARRIGKAPSVIRRVFSSKASNPTLGTVMSMAQALGMELQLKPKKHAEDPDTGRRSLQRRRRSA